MYFLGCWILLVGYLGCQVSSTSQTSLFNRHLKVGAEAWPPFLFINKGKDGNNIYTGLMWDFMEFIKDVRNCTVTVVRPPDGRFGHCYGNGTCSGMIGLVNRGEVDFALGMISSQFYANTLCKSASSICDSAVRTEDSHS